jgi:hypothetical protein
MDYNFIQFHLLNNWLFKIKNHEINEEILLLIFQKNINKMIKQIFEDFSKSNKVFINLIDLDKIENSNTLNNNENIIIFSKNDININKINNNKYKIILLVDDKSFNIENHIKNILSNKNSIISKDFGPINYLENRSLIQKTNPIEIINTFNYFLIESKIFSLFYRKMLYKEIKIFSNLNILQNKDFPYGVINLRVQIEKEIHLLCENKILTSRLAIAIYKSCTLNFSTSNTYIGNFFRKQLGIKSSTYHLTDTIFNIKYQKVKAYKLNKSSLFK